MARRGRPRKKHIEVEEEYYSLNPETKKGIAIVFLAVLAVISLLSFLNLAGTAGLYINNILSLGFGVSKYIFPVILLAVIFALTPSNKNRTSWITHLGLLLFVLSFNGIIHLYITKNLTSFALDAALEGLGGGLAGLILSYPLQLFLGYWAGLVILISLIVISILLIFNTGLLTLLQITQLNKLFAIFKNPFATTKSTETEEDYHEEEDNTDYNEDADNNDETPSTAAVPIKKLGLFGSKPTPATESVTQKMASSKYKKMKIDLPLNLLSNKVSKPRSGDVNASMAKIESTLSNFGIDVEMGDVSVGPTVTQYTFKPAEGVKLSKITTLSNDLALALAAHPIRIEAPIPGKSLVGVEVPNHQPAMVTLRGILESQEFKHGKTSLMMGLGQDVSGKSWSADLSSMPHLLVAGATGSGKSVCLNTIIISLLYQNNPDNLRLILVDPKRVEFPVYNGIPHLLAPVITDISKIINALRWAIHEMDQRFDILSEAGKRNIASYNETAENKMPYLVIVIDELADIMVAASAEVEASIIRLTQMARAVGIHLIVATQRPSVDVITGLIKANIPARIAFSVASSMDSRTILDTTGADKLIGKGDMLFQTAELSRPRRLQGAYVSDEEIKRIVRYLKQIGGEPEYDAAITEKQSSKSSFDFNGGDTDDDLFDDAKQIVIQAGKASASLLQRRLRVGYARAARLIDLLEDNGIVGPADGAKPRDILVRADMLDQGPTTPSVFRKTPSVIEPADDSDETYDDIDNNDDQDSPEEEESDDDLNGDISTSNHENEFDDSGRG
ncbi:TPA: cell division protein FtsK [Candidatus Falkowbacteria bacterium]|nr:cell division protein FtsK [Candidatus Falkowbacteria bacterium]